MLGEKAVLKLISGAMIRAAERCRGLPVTDFERRQLEALKAELDTECPARIGRPVAAPSLKFPALMGLDRLERSSSNGRVSVGAAGVMPLLGVSERKKTILVTGGAGFIGSHLCKTLLDRGSTVIGVDNLITGSVQNILALEKHPRFSFLRQDITKPNFVGSLGRRHFDEVFNLACPTGVPTLGVLAREMLLTSSIGSKNVFDVAHASRARVVLASTAEVYGQAQVFPQYEEYEGAVNPVGPRSPYEEGKRFAESLAVMYGRKYDLDISIVRIFNTYGTGMAAHDQRVIPKFRQAVRRREPLPIYGDGSQRRTFLYIDDLIRASSLSQSMEKRARSIIAAARRRPPCSNSPTW